MTDNVPVFVTRVNLAKAGDSILISMEAPTGGLIGGTVDTREVARVVLSNDTFRQVCEMFGRTLAAIDGAKAKPASREQRTFGSGQAERSDEAPDGAGEAVISGPPTKH